MCLKRRDYCESDEKWLRSFLITEGGLPLSSLKTTPKIGGVFLNCGQRIGRALDDSRREISSRVVETANTSKEVIVKESVGLLKGIEKMVKNYVHDVDRDVRRMFGGR